LYSPYQSLVIIGGIMIGVVDENRPPWAVVMRLSTGGGMMLPPTMALTTAPDDGDDDGAGRGERATY
jgi:hypothetical protein